MSTIASRIRINASIIDDAIRDNRSFAVAIMPGEDNPHIFGLLTDDKIDNSEVSFEIIPWLGQYEKRCIFHKYGIQNIESLGLAESMPRESTRKVDYLHSVDSVIERCRIRKGKTVISRVICNEFKKDGLTIGEIAVKYFEAFPQTFRYILYTPKSGGWIAATPETLVDINMNNGEISTMAFAGTRKAGSRNDWDEKNRAENAFVLNYISEKLYNLGLKPEISAWESVRFGEIEHLCYHIQAKATSINIAEIVDALNPTPALCGVPSSAAIADIKTMESHPRGCYGGVVAFAQNGNYHAYVNLRCMQFTAQGFCIYGGGGITENSIPQIEFDETEAKTEFLQNLVNQ